MDKPSFCASQKDYRLVLFLSYWDCPDLMMNTVSFGLQVTYSGLSFWFFPLKSRIAVPSIEPWRTCSFRLTTGLGGQKSSILIMCLLLCWHCTLHQRVKAGLGELNTLFQRWVYHSLMLDKLVQRTPQKEVNLWTASRQDALHIFLLCSLFWQK